MVDGCYYATGSSVDGRTKARSWPDFWGMETGSLESADGLNPGADRSGVDDGSGSLVLNLLWCDSCEEMRHSLRGSANGDYPGGQGKSGLGSSTLRLLELLPWNCWCPCCE